jgi:hypothetical protein
MGNGASWLEVGVCRYPMPFRTIAENHLLHLVLMLRNVIRLLPTLQVVSCHATAASTATSTLTLLFVGGYMGPDRCEKL